MVTLIKFMTKEELVNMLVQIKNFRNPMTGKYHKKYVTDGNKWSMAEHSFRLENLDFVDALICEEGYVRYTGKSQVVLEMMKERFGFVEE